jgi:3-hydroxyisobutyrate dehydrogenase
MTSASEQSQPRVALFGLGLMGSGMARRLLGAGFPLTIYNRTADKAAPLVAEGARLAKSPSEAADGAAFIVSMVADDTASRRVWLGDEGALHHASPGAILIESSTVSTAWIRELAQSARTAGAELLDAPVTGSRTQAAAGDLRFLVGGSEDAVEKARPLFAAMGRSVVHLGPTGAGALLKLINNFLCGVQATALAEAVALIEKAGLERDVATRVLADGAPGSPLVKGILPRMVAADYAPHFRVSLMQKDLEYSLKEGERSGVALSMARPAIDAFRRAASSGHGAQDVSAVIEPLRE